jgi:hypothetical protein
VGEYCRGRHDALTPDVRDVASQSLYDSTVGLLSGDTMGDPSIYVTYHDAQAYPEVRNESVSIMGGIVIHTQVQLLESDTHIFIYF